MLCCRPLPSILFTVLVLVPLRLAACHARGRAAADSPRRGQPFWHSGRLRGSVERATSPASRGSVQWRARIPHRTMRGHWCCNQTRFGLRQSDDLPSCSHNVPRPRAPHRPARGPTTDFFPPAPTAVATMTSYAGLALSQSEPATPTHCLPLETTRVDRRRSVAARCRPAGSNVRRAWKQSHPQWVVLLRLAARRTPAWPQR